ncbi:hypothetical protein [Paenibacillus wulumuqiensis]|uniref:hypothetical protein n=1 Tax=Paenibacillus wulumuqiensis TaxID=1567107 RepID=UPI000697538F|nr:hypothetical protein [Paenibacillus wulumuqiensis]
MNRMIWIRMLAVAGLLFLLSGCSFNPLSDPKTLIQTPELPSDKQTLSSVISAELPEGASIQSPKSGNTSRIQTVDLDGDGTSETIVFYQTTNGRINGMIFEQSGDTWVKQLDINGAGFTLESVEITDITGDGRRNLLVGYSNDTAGSENTQKTLVVYDYNNGKLTKETDIPYSYYETIDMDGDGINNLTTMTMNSNPDYVSVTVYNYNNGFKKLDSIDLNNIVSAYNVVAGKVSPDQNGIIMDQALGKSGFSHLFIMRNGRLEDAFQLSRQATWKDLQIVSEDINNDGILEIGMLEIPAGWENIAPVETPMFTNYYQWSGSGFLEKLVSQQYRDEEGRFVIKIASDWMEKITLDTKSNKDKDLRFVLKDTGEKVAEVRFFSENEWNNHNGDWEIIAENRGQVIALWENNKVNIIQN